MNITGTIRVNPPAQILKNHGLDKNGDVQKFHTQNAIRRIQKYMPFRAGMMIKLMVAQSPISEPLINVDVPQARVMYYGKVMVDSQTGKGPALIPDVGFRFRRGAILKPTDRPLKYTTTKNPQAGPFWDRRLMAAEKEVMRQELQDYVDRRK